MTSPTDATMTNASQGDDNVFDQIRLLRIQAQCLIRPPPPRPPPANRTWKPSSGVDTEHQEKMIFHNKLWGLRGLNRYLAKRAEQIIEDQDTTDNSFQRIYNDFKWGSAAESYLASLHPDTLVSVLDGSFFFRQSQDAEFRARVEHTTTIRPVPGVYLVGWARSSNEKEHEGKGVSLNELLEIHRHMTQYIDLSDTAFMNTARDIDGAIPINNCQHRDYTADRRYRYTKFQAPDFATIQNWLDFIREEYLQFMDTVTVAGGPVGWTFDEPMVRVLVYCGWGILTSNRAQSHEHHPPGESPLYGLFSATLVHLYGDKFRFRAMQLFTCYDKRDAALCEILGHDIASSRLNDCGLNGAIPGGVGANNIALAGPGFQLIWQRNQEFIRGTGLIPRNLRANIERLGVMRRVVEAIPTIDADLARARADARELYDKVEALAEEAEEVKTLCSLKKLQDLVAKVRLEESGAQ